MASPDDPDFEDFVEGIMDGTFSSVLHEMDTDSDRENLLINNITDSESDNDGSQNIQPGPSTSTTFQPTAVSTPYKRPPITQPAAPQPAPPAAPSVPQSAPPPALQPPPPTPTTRPTQQNNPPLPANTWKDVTDNDTGPSTTIPVYNINPGPVLPSHFTAETDPVDYFKLFFNNDIVGHICKETNMFANKKRARALSPRARLNAWKDITPMDFDAFLGTIINMGLIPLPAIYSYFTTAWEGRIPFFRDVFNRDEFLNIFWNIHFNHIEAENAQVPRGFLIAPILTHMKKMSRLFYNTSSRVAIDESTISFKGKVHFKIFNPNKPTKFGLKVFVASDSKNGYIYDFLPYFGQETLIPNTNLLKTTQIVKVLSESVVMKDPANPVTGIHIYTDRYYTSPELANELLKIGCYLTGTVMTNRVGLPPGMKATGKKMKKGDICSKRKGSTLVLSWRDKRAVHMLSTFSKGSKSNMTNVPSKWPNKPPTLKPDVIIDYTKHMGGVDRSDHFISSYQFMRRTKKWYRKLFFWLLEVAIIDAYILYQELQKTFNKKPMTHREFRTTLVKRLVAEKVAVDRPKARKRGRPAQGPPNQRLDGKPHFMDRKEKGSKKCVVCASHGLRKETIYFCKTCAATPALHPDKCFEQYHTLTNF